MYREDGREIHHRSSHESDCTGSKPKIGALFPLAFYGHHHREYALE
jgi:hypothetical protein